MRQAGKKFTGSAEVSAFWFPVQFPPVSIPVQPVDEN